VKLGEALLERDHLKQRLDLLEARLRDDHAKGRPLAHLREELQRTANRWRDLEIAIAWTEQQVAISGLPLGAYLIRQEAVQRLSAIMKGVDREKEDELLESAHADTKVFEAAIWLIDLQVPGIKTAPEDKSQEEE